MRIIQLEHNKLLLLRKKTFLKKFFKRRFLEKQYSPENSRKISLVGLVFSQDRPLQGASKKENIY
jgi:hypothetical protein